MMKVWQRVLVLLAGSIQVYYGAGRSVPMTIEKLVQLGAQAHIKTLAKRERRKVRAA